MDTEFETVRYYIQQESPQDTHPAILRLRRPRGGSWQGHYWDRRVSDWQFSEDIVRHYWNGFDPDVGEVSEQAALTRIQSLPSLTTP